MIDINNRIICGNAMDVMSSLAPDSVDLVITSPPYFGLRCYGDETLGRESDPREYVADLLPFMSAVKRVLSPHGSFYLNIGDVYFGTKGFSRNTGEHKRKTDHHYLDHRIVKPDGKYLQHKQLLLLPARVAVGMQDDGWLLRNDIIWEKPNAMPNYAKDRRLPVYEHIFHFSKSPRYYFDYGQAKRLNHHRDVIRHTIRPYRKHQATFPEELVEALVLTTSRPGDIVLDPFVGSGTVPAICARHGRRYIGIELNQDYCRIAEDRIAEQG